MKLKLLEQKRRLMSLQGTFLLKLRVNLGKRQGLANAIFFSNKPALNKIPQDQR